MYDQSSVLALSDQLAINGGPKAVTALPPESWLHGPQEIGEEEIQAVTEVLRSKNLFRFMRDRETSSVAKFEDLFAKKTGAKYALAVNSGTSALIVGLIGLGVSQGDEVLIPAYTYIATAAAILAIGAIPVIVEIDASLTIDPEDIEGRITPRTKAIIPVHMRGMPCDMERIGAIAKRNGLGVLEDCAQANGAEYRGRAVGTLGDIGAFSLQHFKIITSGEGGAIITNQKDVFDRAAIYHDSAYAFWMEQKQASDEAAQDWRKICFLGENYRQSELHGAVAFEQLKKRDGILARTRSIKRRFRAALENIEGIEMETLNDPEGDCGISIAFFAQDSETANALAQVLGEEGVSCGTSFSKQIPNRHIFYHWDYVLEKRTPHLNGFPWKSDGQEIPVEYHKDMCPKTNDLLERAVVMPITQAMSDAYVDEVCTAIEKVARLWGK